MATLTELRAKAKQLGIKGYYRMNKAELEARLKPKKIKVKRKKEKKTVKEEGQKQLELEDLTRDKSQVVAEQLKKAVKNMTFTQASQVVVKFITDNLTNGGISSDDLDRDRNIVRAMALMKLNIFTVNKLIAIENYESYYQDAVSSAEMAIDDDNMYQYVDSDDAILTIPVAHEDVSAYNDDFLAEMEDVNSFEEAYGAFLDFLKNVSFIRKYNTKGTLYLRDYAENDPDLERIFSYSADKMNEAFDTYIALDLFGDREITSFYELDDDEDVDFDEVKDKFRFSVIADRFHLDLGDGEILLDAEDITNNYDADEQREAFGKVIAVKDDDDDFIGFMSNDRAEDLVNEIRVRGDWIANMPSFTNILSGLVYGYQDGEDIQEDLEGVNEERYTDYYGFSFTRIEYIDGERYTVASNNRLNDILNELARKNSVIRDAEKLQEIAQIRLSQGEPKFSM